MKSHVTMAVCPICQETTGEILLDKRLRPIFEMKTMTPMPYKHMAFCDQEVIDRINNLAKESNDSTKTA